MKFKSKLRKIGNSLGVLIPREVISDYKEGDIIELKIITEFDNEDNWEKIDTLPI